MSSFCYVNTFYFCVSKNSLQCNTLCNARVCLGLRHGVAEQTNFQNCNFEKNAQGTNVFTLLFFK